MAKIRPFSALRYSPEVLMQEAAVTASNGALSAGSSSNTHSGSPFDLSSLIAPPYDVIDGAEQERLYSASKYNIVRLILGKQSSSDTDSDNRYTRAQKDFDAWRKQGILQCDEKPAIYCVEHAYRYEGKTHRRLGFIALMELHDNTENDVYRHEETLSRPKQDRAKLLEAVPANLSPIFCVYPDKSGSVQSILQEITSQDQASVKADIKDQAVRMWAVSDETKIAQIRQVIDEHAVLIADGHHRFEVAFGNRKQYGFVMAYFVSMSDPSLLIRPIHRVVRHSEKPSLSQLQQFCDLEKADNIDAVSSWLEANEKIGQFGVYDGDSYWKVEIKQAALEQWVASKESSTETAEMDIFLLHGFLLPCLGKGCECQYIADYDRAVKAVDSDRQKIAWFLRSVSLKKVYDLASKGITLPPKSTFFYPKVLTGLTLNTFERSQDS